MVPLCLNEPLVLSYGAPARHFNGLASLALRLGGEEPILHPPHTHRPTATSSSSQKLCAPDIESQYEVLASINQWNFVSTSRFWPMWVHCHMGRMASWLSSSWRLTKRMLSPRHRHPRLNFLGFVKCARRTYDASLHHVWYYENRCASTLLRTWSATRNGTEFSVLKSLLGRDLGMVRIVRHIILVFWCWGQLIPNAL